jgi:hypothetical protein
MLLMQRRSTLEESIYSLLRVPTTAFSLFKHLRVALTSRESICQIASRNYPHVTMHISREVHLRVALRVLHCLMMVLWTDDQIGGCFFLSASRAPISKPHLTLGTPSGHVKAGSYEPTPRRHVSQWIWTMCSNSRYHLGSIVNTICEDLMWSFQEQENLHMTFKKLHLNSYFQNLKWLSSWFALANWTRPIRIWFNIQNCLWSWWKCR